jgi:hypothetical protein
VRCLAVLSGLLCMNSDKFTIPSQPPEVLVLQKPPRPSRNCPFAVRITAADGSMLPSEFSAPRSLSKLFGEYEPKAVAFNRAGFIKKNGVRFWWVSLLTLESFELFFLPR